MTRSRSQLEGEGRAERAAPCSATRNLVRRGRPGDRAAVLRAAGRSRRRVVFRRRVKVPATARCLPTDLPESVNYGFGFGKARGGSQQVDTLRMVSRRRASDSGAGVPDGARERGHARGDSRHLGRHRLRFVPTCSCRDRRRPSRPVTAVPPLAGAEGTRSG